ncbi:hypothetical protein ABJI51_04570 [Amycolatopsis sp. NEAU-NG30]|uniref:Lipoprotein n=1 Tax=Amycolatopsis melonis TaxID=3156488 RepID=A0ABV0L7P2_9PSEU
MFGHRNEKRLIHTAGLLLAVLALAGCGSAEPPTPAKPSPATVSAATPVQTRPYDLFQLYRHRLPVTAGTACRADPAPSDPACGEELQAIRRNVEDFRAALAKAFPGKDFPKIRESADQLTRYVDLLTKMNCYGLNGPGKKPGKNEGDLCGTFGKLALLGWLSFETTVEES